MKVQNFHTKLPCQKPMLRQIEWGVQNGPITKNGLLSLAASFFWQFNLSIRISYRAGQIYLNKKQKKNERTKSNSMCTSDQGITTTLHNILRLWCFSKFLFHQKWSDVRLLFIIMVYSSCRTTSDLES